jgi:acyl-CoA thioesterase FadM
VTEPVWEFPLGLPRHAFSARDAARAGDVWRCFQEAAVEASTRAGWPPQRYRETRTAFVVRTMTVRHFREAEYGEPTRARTWVSRFRRDMFTTRQLRLFAEFGPVAAATQEWVVVSAELKPIRGGKDLLDAFPIHEEDTSVEMPEYEALEGPSSRFAFDAWFTAMDPLDHVNHPAYLDFCDEAISRHMASAGLSPVALMPIAETATFRAGLSAAEPAVVETTPVGRTAEGHLVCKHRVLRGDTVCADLTTVRSLAGADPSSLVAAFTAE